MKIKTLTLRLDDELHRQFKIYSINKNEDMQSILVNCIQQLLEHENDQDEDIKK